MNQMLYEHPATGVFLHVEYMPPTLVSKCTIHDVRIADTNYAPVGPNLCQFLDSTYSVHTGDAGVTMATPLLELIGWEIANGN
jgi:hypothetical protein